MQSGGGQMLGSLFGSGVANEVPLPKVPYCEPWSLIERLKHEKEVIGIYLSGDPLDEYAVEIQSFCSSSIADLPKHTGKDAVTLGCIVTDIKVRTAKNGNSFAIATVEDFTETFELSLFGSDYVNFRNYFEPGNTLQLKGSYKPGWRGDQLEFKLQQVALLSELRQNIRRVTVNVYLHEVTERFIQTVARVCTQHPGNTPLHIRVYQPKQNTTSSYLVKGPKLLTSTSPLL